MIQSEELLAEPTLPRLVSKNLVEQTVETLRSHILSGKFGSEDILPSQGQLCEQLNVSRSVIREAMRTLQSQGLIDVSQGRRPRILPAQSDTVVENLEMLLKRRHLSLLELVEVRLPLECEIASLAANRITPLGLERLHESQAALSAADRLEEHVAADVLFHQILAEETGNPLFAILLDVLKTLLHESRQRTIRQSGKDVVISHHARILKAVETRDAELARKEMLFHLTSAQQDIERYDAIGGTTS